MPKSTLKVKECESIDKVKEEKSREHKPKEESFREAYLKKKPFVTSVSSPQVAQKSLKRNDFSLPRIDQKENANLSPTSSFRNF